MADYDLLERRKAYQEELNGVETEDDTITPLATNHAPPSHSRRGRRQTLAVTDAVDAFGRRRILSPRLGKRSSELDQKWKARRGSEFVERSQDWLFASLPPGRKWYLPPNHPFLLVEIELENGGNFL